MAQVDTVTTTDDSGDSEVPDALDLDWYLLTAEHIQDKKLKALYSNIEENSNLSHCQKLTQSQFIDCYTRNMVSTHVSLFDALSMYQLVYWTEVRAGYTHWLVSEKMKKLFYHVESTPLLVVLEDCLERIDNFLMSSLVPGTENLDEKYVAVLEIACLLRQREVDIRWSWRNVVKTALAHHQEQAGFAQSCYPHILSTLKKLQECVNEVLDKFLTGSLKPMLVQLCNKLHLSQKEVVAFNYFFIQNVGILFGKLYSLFTTPSSPTSLGGSRQSSIAIAAAAFADFSSKEMLEFFDESRLHMKQELFEPEDEFSTILTTNFIKLPVTVLRACCGCKLSADELYKVDKTAMGEILAGDSPPKAHQVEADDDSISTEDEELTTELEEVLHTCSISEQEHPEKVDQDLEGSTSIREEVVIYSAPYTTDLEYLEDNFELIETLVKATKTQLSDEGWLIRGDQRKPEAVIRELKAKARSLRAKTEQRLDATKSHSDWLPRLERLAVLRALDIFEKKVLLILTGSMVSKNLRNTGNPNDAIFGHHMTIGSLIGLFCEGLKEQIDCRVYFYKSSRLVSGGLVHVTDPPLHSRGNFLDSVVELDRRLLDYIVGLDTEISELVEGSDLYTPNVGLDDVSLPADHRELLISTLQSFEKLEKTCKKLGLVLKQTSKGLCLLFYGPSGTGKTMTANAVAHFLSKKILSVTVSALTDRDVTKELLRFLFRESKIHNAILFFDECETLFETRENRSNQALGVLLTEIENYEGIIVLATNRHQDLDEAMHRRIHVSLPFSVPDYTLREAIWKSHIPSSICREEINWTNLALDYELTGGLIANAVLAAISLALKTSGEENLMLTEEHLHSGAKQQLNGLLEMVDFERRVIPTFGLSDLVLPRPVAIQVDLILKAGKTHKFLSAQWGFGGQENCADAAGISVLICGDPGTGKTALAHSIAFELGQPVKEANCTELLSHTVSMAMRANRGVAAFFQDAHKTNAVVVLDGADILLSNTASSLMSGLVGCEHFTLIHQIEHYKGIVMLTSRKKLGLLDLGRMPQLKHVVELDLPPTELREQMWRKLLPHKAPVDPNIDFKLLAQSYGFTGGDIAKVICQAAESCALTNTKIENHRLIQAAESELKRRQKNIGLLSYMYV